MFLGKSREYLAEGDLHQASEKGWGAAAWMAKAAAEAHGWEYKKHDHFHVVLRNAMDGQSRSRDSRLGVRSA
jgi:diadenosine tetraphosphate (Ap4A) HIT family hydrolase